MVSNPYPMLTYPVRVDCKVGELHGWDETFRPYEIFEVAVFRQVDSDDCTCDQGEEGFQSCPWHVPGCDVCGRETTHTHVYLQYAEPETVKEQGQAYMQDMRLRGLL